MSGIIAQKPLFPSEAGHYYRRDGSPCYEIERADGKGLRETTLRDARKLNLLPSVTAIIAVAARPGLEIWKAEQLMLAALTLPRNVGEGEKEWLGRVREDSKAQAEKAREKGNQIHAALDGAFAGEDFGPEYVNEIASVTGLLNTLVPHTKWTGKVCFASEEGYGGALDLHGMAVDGNVLTIADFKSTEFRQPDIRTKVFAYDEHMMQLAAYANGVDPKGEYKHRLINLYVSTVEPGLVYPHEWAPEDEKRGLTMFRALLAYWQASRNYYPTADGL